jgi:hypothetical protein
VPGTIVAIVALPLIHRKVDVELRDQICARFAACYPDFDIDIRSAVRVEGKGVEVRGLTIRDPGLKGPEAVVVDVEQISVCCTTDLADWVAKRINVGQVTIRRPTFRVTRLPDGTWSFEKFLPLPKSGNQTPDFYVENGTIELVDATKPKPGCWTLRDVSFSVLTRRDEKTGRLVRKIEGHVMGDYLDRVEFKGQASMDFQKWAVAGAVARVDITPEFHQALPGLPAKDAKVCAGFRGRASAQFRLQSDPTCPMGIRFEVAGDIKQGRFDDARLPYPITDIHARFCATPKGFSLTEFQGWFGRAVLSLTCYRAGYDSYSLWDVNATVKNLQLEPRLVAGLPEKFQRGWRKFTPSGRVDATVKLLTDGHTVRPEHLEAVVDARDITTIYEKFPYRLEKGFGRLTLKNNTLTIHNMEFRGGNDQAVWVKGIWADPFKPKPCGWVEVYGYGLAIDKRVYDALEATNEHGYNIMRLLALGGITDFWGRVERKTSESEPLKHYVITFRDASLCFDRFPYPLQHLQGRVERYPDKSWKFSNLRAVNRSGVVTAAGGIVKHGEDDYLLHLDIDGKNVALGEDLYNAVARRPAMGQAWKNTQPSGIVDVKTVIDWTVKEKKLDMTVTATPRGKTVSIEPVSFPYRLDGIQGSMVFHDGLVTFDQFRGQHGATTVSGKGSCAFLPDGKWELRFKKMEVSDLQLTRELIQACPGQLRKGLTQLNPKGSMYIAHGLFVLNRSLDPNEPPRAAWDLVLGVQQGSIDCGIRLDNLNGKVNLRGHFDGKEHWSKGELDLDSVMYKGFQFAEVRGPLWINNEAVLFGSPDYWKKPVREKPNPKRPAKDQAVDARPLTAKLYEGQTILTGWVDMSGKVPRYAMGAYLTHGNLARFTKEIAPGTQDVTGQFGGQVQISGAGRTLNGLQGSGRLWLRQADIYELPSMVRLLKLLRVKQPDGTAFSKADIRFTIKDRKVYMNQIEFNGDAISLVGDGAMDFESKIDLTLSPIVGRNDVKLPVISPILFGASKQAVAVRVKGPLSDPEIHRDVLPEVKGAISRLEENSRSR